MVLTASINSIDSQPTTNTTLEDAMIVSSVDVEEDISENATQRDDMDPVAGNATVPVNATAANGPLTVNTAVDDRNNTVDDRINAVDERLRGGDLNGRKKIVIGKTSKQYGHLGLTPPISKINFCPCFFCPV